MKIKSACDICGRRAKQQCLNKGQARCLKHAEREEDGRIKEIK